jgi:hypothetical protein
MGKIEITSPKPFQNVGATFVISGKVPLSWLKTSYGFSRDISLELIDIKAQTILGSNVSVDRITFLSKILGYVSFREMFQFNQFNVGFIKKSQGRMTIKLSGQNEKEQSIFIPIIVKELEPEEGVGQKILERHGKIGETIRQYEQDLKDYYKGLAEIVASRKAKDDNEDSQYLGGPNALFAHEILKIIEDSDDNFRTYAYSEEDKRERELNNKYKNALEWRGPLLRGLVSQFNGFELRVHSGDHGKHFHITHKGRGVNVRFSFPEMRLVSYVNSRNTIGSKLEKSIRDFCLQPEIFKKFEEEFKKRSA